jgi:hypothetical protein
MTIRPLLEIDSSSSNVTSSWAASRTQFLCSVHAASYDQYPLAEKILNSAAKGERDAEWPRDATLMAFDA